MSGALLSSPTGLAAAQSWHRVPWPSCLLLFSPWSDPLCKPQLGSLPIRTLCSHHPHIQRPLVAFWAWHSGPTLQGNRPLPGLPTGCQGRPPHHCAPGLPSLPAAPLQHPGGRSWSSAGASLNPPIWHLARAIYVFSFSHLFLWTSLLCDLNYKALKNRHYVSHVCTSQDCQ